MSIYIYIYYIIYNIFSTDGSAPVIIFRDSLNSIGDQLKHGRLVCQPHNIMAPEDKRGEVQSVMNIKDMEIINSLENKDHTLSNVLKHKKNKSQEKVLESTYSEVARMSAPFFCNGGGKQIVT